MEFREPKIFMLAKTELSAVDLNSFLHHVGAPDWTTDAESDGEELVEVAGRLCYKSFEPGLNKNVTKVREGNKPYLGNVLKQKHGSVFEHATVTFAFMDVTRVFTHEVVRHRHCSFSQESLRYVRLADLKAFYPEQTMGEEDSWYRGTMQRVFEELESEQVGLSHAFNLDEEGDFAKKKKITSAMRRLAPIGLCTNIIVTANHRGWRDIIMQRCNEHAEEEIRYVTTMVAKRLKMEFPAIYQDMTFETAEDGGPVVKLAHGRV